MIVMGVVVTAMIAAAKVVATAKGAVLGVVPHAVSRSFNIKMVRLY